MQPRESLVVFVHGLHHGIQPLCRGRDLITGNFRHWVLSGSQNQLCSLPIKQKHSKFKSVFVRLKAKLGTYWKHKKQCKEEIGVS